MCVCVCVCVCPCMCVIVDLYETLFIDKIICMSTRGLAVNQIIQMCTPRRVSLERVQTFFIVNANRIWDTLVCHATSTFGSPTRIQDKKIFTCTRAVCCVPVDLNALVNTVHTLKYIPFAQTMNKIT